MTDRRRRAGSWAVRVVALVVGAGAAQTAAATAVSDAGGGSAAASPMAGTPPPAVDRSAMPAPPRRAGPAAPTSPPPPQAPAAVPPTLAPSALASALSARLPASEVPVMTLLSQTVQVQAGSAAMALGLWGDALAMLRGTERDLPQIGDLIVSRQAEAHRALGRWEEAQALWRQAAARGSSPLVRGRALFGIADADFAAGRWADAQENYLLALAQPAAVEQRPQARLNLAIMAQGRGDVAQAARILLDLAFRGRDGDLAARAEAALAALPSAPPAAAGGGPPAARSWGPRLERLDRRIRVRDFAGAAADLAALRALAPSADDRLQLDVRGAQLTLRQGAARAAVPQFEALLRRRRGADALAATRDLAAALAADGQHDRALARLMPVARREARTPAGRDAWLRAVQMAMEAGNHAWAYREASAFLKRFPRDRLGEDMRWLQGWSAYRQGELGRAARALAAAEGRATRGPLRDRARYWRGRTAMGQGRLAEAREMMTPLARTPTLYYGLWAQARLREMRARPSPRAAHELQLVGRAEVGPGAVGGPPLGPHVALPAALLSHLAAVQPDDPATPTPAVVDDQVGFALERLQLRGAQAARLETLILVEAREELSRLILSLSPRAGHSGREVTLARAQLASLAGSPSTAFRLVSLAFADVLAGGHAPEVRGLFALAYPQVAAQAVRAAAAERKINPALIWAVMRQESSFDASAHSAADARGLMQVIPATGRRIAQATGNLHFEDAHLMRPQVSVAFGGWYLAQLLARYGGNAALAAAAYNAGPPAVDGWLAQRAPLATDVFIEDIPFRETRQYVKNVVGNLVAYHELYQSGPLLMAQYVRAGPRGARRGVDY